MRRQPLCRALEAYGITYPPAQLVELAACDAPIAEALNGKAVGAAWLCSTRPQIAQYGFVVLCSRTTSTRSPLRTWRPS